MYRKLCVTSRIACQFIIALAAVALIGSATLAGTDTTLYDVDFNGPPHVVGLTPAFAAGPFPRNTPTAGGQILAPTGTAIVVPAFGLLNDRPVRLTALDGTPDESILGGADLHFDLSDPQLSSLDVFHAQVDVLIGDISTSAGMGIFFDAPAIHAVEFGSDGSIRVIDATGVNQVVGAQVAETVYTIGMTFDRAAAQWAAAINGIPVYQGPVDDTDLKTFRIATTTGSTNVTSSVYVDNIRITAVVPEPGTLSLAATVLAGALSFAARRRRQP